MPVTVSKRSGKYRVIEASSRRIAKNKARTSVDGGGHRTKKAAQAQARAINAHLYGR